ncbi:MAG: sigma-70 region 4 domain-containing protein [Candidatus Eisenbacteria bacterium]
MIGRDSIERYERALERLKPGDRHAIQVRVELDLPYEEIARELGSGTITAARMRVSRALPLGRGIEPRGVPGARA